MSTTLQYRIMVEGPNDDFKLEDQITTLLAEGWQLQGGIAFMSMNGHMWFAQAIYRSVTVPSAEPESLELGATVKEPRMVRRPKP